MSGGDWRDVHCVVPVVKLPRVRLRCFGRVGHRMLASSRVKINCEVILSRALFIRLLVFIRVLVLWWDPTDF